MPNVVASDNVDNFFAEIRCVVGDSFQRTRNQHLSKALQNINFASDRIADEVIAE